MIDYRELLIKHMLCCIECEGSPCLLNEDDEYYAANAGLGISPAEYAVLLEMATIARERAAILMKAAMQSREIPDPPPEAA